MRGVRLEIQSGDEVKPRVIVISVKSIALWGIGLCVLNYAANVYNPPAALQFSCAFIYGWACFKLYPWVSVHQ